MRKRKAQKRKAQKQEDIPTKKLTWRELHETPDEIFIRKMFEKYPPPPFNPNVDGCFGPKEVVQCDLDLTDACVRELAERHALKTTGTRYEVITRRYLHWRAVKLQLGDPYIGYGLGYESTRTPNCVPGFQTRADLDAVQQTKLARTEERERFKQSAKEAEEKLAIETRTTLYTRSGKVRTLAAGNLPPDEIERMILDTIRNVKKRKWNKAKLLANMPGIKSSSIGTVLRAMLDAGKLIKRKGLKIAKNATSSSETAIPRENARQSKETAKNGALKRVAGRYIPGKPMAMLYNLLVDGEWHKKAELGVPSGAVRRLTADGEQSKEWRLEFNGKGTVRMVSKHTQKREARQWTKTSE